MFRVTRAINNNVVLAAEDGSSEERVVMGRGIGFKAAAGDVLDPTRITQVFRPATAPALQRVLDQVEDLPAEDLAVAITIADDAGRRFGADVAQRVLLPLADHLSYALRRTRDGIAIDYPLHWDVAAIYPDEVDFARQAVGTIERLTGTRLPDLEAIPMALHLVNAQFGHRDMGRTVQSTALLSDLLATVGAHLGRRLDPQQLETARFVTHLRYLVARGADARILTDGMGALLVTMRSTYPDHLQCAARCRDIIQTTLKTTLSDDELVYLTLHIARLAG